MYRIVGFNQKEDWQHVIRSFDKNDIYFEWGYIHSFKLHGDGNPFIYYYEDDNGRVANVFFLRDVSEISSFRGELECGQFYDISSVYGYGGILYEGVNLKQLFLNYVDNFNLYCNKNNIICEFIRFNPMIENHKTLIGLYDLAPVRKTVYIDLSKGEEYIWDNLKSENRTRIRKAIKSGIKIIQGRDSELIEKFINLYRHTMDRDNANQYYYFDKEFFYATLRDLPDNSIVFAATYKDKIIAASLILFNDQFIHYHLGGSDKEYLGFAPNNLMFYEVSKWALKRGIKKFHLGGGHASKNDSLFRFKRSFSRVEPMDFYIGRKIHNEQVYNYLVKLREKNDIYFDKLNQYFPKYRG